MRKITILILKEDYDDEEGEELKKDKEVPFKAFFPL